MPRLALGATPEEARLLMIERVRRGEPGGSPREREVAWAGVNMLVSLTGRECSRLGHARRLAEAGLALTSMREGGSEWSVPEARRVPVHE